MAKEKKDDASLGFDEFIERNYKGVVKKGNEFVDKPREIIPTILSLDVALTGGIPEGKIVLFSGQPKGGKSTTCLIIGRNGIRQKRKLFYVDVERRLDPSLIKTIKGLNPADVNIIPGNDQVLTAEEYLNIIERGIKGNPRSIWVIDSIASLSTLIEQTEDVGANKDMAGVPKLLASFIRKIKDIVNINNCVLILISQLQTNRDPASKRKYDEKGGLGIQYGCSIWMNLGWVQQWKKDEVGEIYGQDLHITIKASALGKPYRPCVVPLRYGSGLDEAMDIINHAENLGIINATGAWYSVPMLGNIKAQGRDGIRELLLTDPTYLSKLEAEVRKVVLPNDNQVIEQQDSKVELNEIPKKNRKQIEISK